MVDPMLFSLQLLVAGVVGIYYCATDFEAYSASPKAFVVKVSKLLSSSHLLVKASKNNNLKQF